MSDDPSSELARECARKLDQQNELFSERVTSRTIEWDGLTIKSIETENDFGAGLRIYQEGTPGFCYANHSEFNPKKMVEKSRSVQKFRDSNPDQSIPELSSNLSTESTDKWFDSSIHDDIQTRKAKVEEAINSNLEREQVRTLQVEYGETNVETKIFHRGEEIISHDRTKFSISVWAICESEDDVQTGFEHQGSYRFDKLDFDRIHKEAIQKAQEKLGATNPSSYEGPMIVTKSAASRILGLVRRMVDGEAVVKGRSNWDESRRGEQLAGQNVSIIDDPSLEAGSSNRQFDDEGFPVEPIRIVEDGIYGDFLKNHYVASRSDTDNNHRAARSYSERPSVGATNFYLVPGEKSFDELCNLLDTGPVVTSIQPGSGMDPIAGYFSVGASGYWIEGGTRTEPFDEATLSGEVEEFLKSLQAIGNGLPKGYRVASPSLLVEPLSLGGD